MSAWDDPAAHIRAVETERDRLREVVARVEALFAGGPDTPCRTTWREYSPFGCWDKTECVEVPMDELRAALGSQP